MEPIATESKCGYVVGLRSSRARVEYALPGSLVRRMLAEYGRAQLFEWYQAMTVGKVVFDVDGKTGATSAPALLLAALAAVATFFGHVPEGVVIASSHGGEKLSYRIFVPGFRMRMSDIKKRITRLALDNKSGGPFDTAIYSANQKLRMVGSIKTPADARVLKLIDAEHRDVEPTRERLLDTVVQVVDPSWPLLDEAAGQPLQAELNSDSHQPTRAAPSAADADAGPPRKRGRTRKEDTLPADWRRVLEAMGYSNVHSLKSFSDPTRGQGYSFTSSSRSPCPNCDRAHDGNNWFAVEVEPGVIAVKSHSDHCKYRRARLGDTPTIELIVANPPSVQEKLDALPLVQPLQLNNLDPNLHYHRVACRRPECLACNERHGCDDYILQEVIKNTIWTVRNTTPTCCGSVFHASALLPQALKAVIQDPASTSLTALFLLAHRDVLWCDQSLATIRMWTGARWKTWARASFASYVGHWLFTLLSNVKRMDDYTSCGKQLKAALGMCSSHAQHQSVTTNILSTQCVHCEDMKFDANPNLLGCDDCVIDLKTGQARAPTPDDLVSQSVGYDFLRTDVDMAPLLEIVEQIYPVPEEREFVQRFAGYCLLGSYTEKIFLCFTDRRSGYNGKSTIVKLITRAMGPDYAAPSGKKELLYESHQHQSLNAHDSGYLSFQGKRMAAFEELNDKRALDNNQIKGLTGGGTHIPVRGAFKTETTMMPWTTKLLLAFNEGGCPKLRAEDGALMKRMAVVQHRALFCDKEDDFEKHRHEEFTYRSRTDVHELVPPQAMLHWMLLGLKRYWEVGFRELPRVCTEWKTELMLEHDDVAAWAAVSITSSEGGILLLGDAWERFKQTTDTKIGRTGFSTRLKKLFSEAFSPAHKVAGVSRHNVFRNLALT